MMHTHTCAQCGAQFDSPYSTRQYCSGRCRTASYRAAKRELAARKGPQRQALVGKLEVLAPKTGELARELLAVAGDDCTELLVRLIGQAVCEIDCRTVKGR